ncbi:MAG: AAA family ATPase [Desulfobacteraceae bacterium]|nr:AAA family ATPase [Desulfobacteraceae bacterium]
MYTQHFGMKKRPFVLSPDPDFLFFSKGHDLAFTHLEYGLLHNAGFIALTGEVGAGKTTLLKYLLEKIDPAQNVAMIFNTQVDPHSLLEMLAREFGIKKTHRLKSDLFASLQEYLIREYSAGKRCVVVVDEAQNLSTSAFEELRMLSNLDAGSELLLQIILVGQPQLRKRLSDPALAQLTQRISVHYHLTPMGPEEVEGYIEHRLKVSGRESPDRLFQKEAVELVAEISAGVPRVINSICDTCLTYAFADRLEIVARNVVEKVSRDNSLLLAGVASRGGSEEDTGNGESFGVEQKQTGSSGAFPELRCLIADLLRRLGAVEIRLEELTAVERTEAVRILEKVLARERAQALQNSVRLNELMRAYEQKVRELDSLKKELSRDETEPKKRWRVLGRVF